MSPCAVRITPARPGLPGNWASILKNGTDESWRRTVFDGATP
jgi:hypothetical protein